MQRGFTYLALLFYLAVLSAGLATVAVSWQTARQREKEEELLFAGAAIREAIALYYNRPPGGVQVGRHIPTTSLGGFDARPTPVLFRPARLSAAHTRGGRNGAAKA